MFRFWGLVLPNSKATLAAVGILLAVAAFAIARQLSSAQTSPNNSPQIVHSVNLPFLSNSSTDSSDPAADIKQGSNTNSSQTSVTVNGQSIDVPDNGSVNQTIQTGGGTATV